MKHCDAKLISFLQLFDKQSEPEQAQISTYTCKDFQNNDPDANGVGYDLACSGKLSKRLSLLGHGPHGKQVVEYLLEEYGDDGILQFCQRWRQVFVEAVNPRFLPSGWDIMHRYMFPSLSADYELFVHVSICSFMSAARTAITDELIWVSDTDEHTDSAMWGCQIKIQMICPYFKKP